LYPRYKCLGACTMWLMSTPEALIWLAVVAVAVALLMLT
jgi:hypothetical protein